MMQLVEGPTKQFDQIDSLFGEDFYFYLKGSFNTNFSIDDLLEGPNLI